MLGALAALLLSTAEVCVLARVSDGDTVTCVDGRKIRLLLVDAPERAQGEVANASTRALLELAPLGTPLRVELDVQPKDKYRRTLAYLWLPDGRLLNEELARRGAVVSLSYPPNLRHLERIRGAVEEAKGAKRGLWAPGALSCAPRDFRHGKCPKP